MNKVMYNVLNNCIAQGYVPADCQLDGLLVWLMVREGRNPCAGCNMNCVHRIPACVVERSTQRSNGEVERQARITKRMWLGANTEPLMYVETDKHGMLITVLSPNAEKGYVVHCTEGIDMLVYYIKKMCKKYSARQVFISEDVAFLYKYLDATDLDIEKLDIIPISYVDGSTL